MGRSATRARIGFGEGELAAEVVGLDGADAEVGADGGDPIVLGEAGAGGPAVGELGLLVGEGEVLALVLVGLDAADLVRGGLVVEQGDDQAADRLQAVAGERVAGSGGEQPPLAGVEHDRAAVGVGAVADAGHELAHGHEHVGEPFDAVGGDLAAGVGRELEVVERDAHERAGGFGGRGRGDVEERGRRGRRGGCGHGGPFGTCDEAAEPKLSCGAARGPGGSGESALGRRELDAVGVDEQVEGRQGGGQRAEPASAVDVERAVVQFGGDGRLGGGRVVGVDGHEDRGRGPWRRSFLAESGACAGAVPGLRNGRRGT